jgi:hypothetical protein
VNVQMAQYELNIFYVFGEFLPGVSYAYVQAYYLASVKMRFYHHGSSPFRLRVG